MYRLDLKSQPKTIIGQLNMVVCAKSQLRFTGPWSLQKNKCADPHRSSVKVNKDVIKT